LYSGYELWRLRLFSFCGYGLALAALALVLFGAYDSYPGMIGVKLQKFHSVPFFLFAFVLPFSVTAPSGRKCIATHVC